MMDLLAQILEEAFWGLKARDTVEALECVRTIKELIEQFNEDTDANQIPEEMRLV